MEILHDITLIFAIKSSKMLQHIILTTEETR